VNFKKIEISQGTEISHDLLYSMARNDDIIKKYYEAAPHGILGWVEFESNISISAFDPLSVDGEDDPEWYSLAVIPAYIEDNRIIKMSMKGLTVMHQSTTLPATVFQQALNGRFVIQYSVSSNDIDGDSATTAYVPYRMLMSGNFIDSNQNRQYGRIFGHNVCVSVKKDQKSAVIHNNFNTTTIEPGQCKINFQVKRLSTPMEISASGESKLQIMIEDLGAFQ
jgi:hypothetical protein